tara:strand:- start:353 stop:538 length:186 start_codon:yes stop_codon:yes gene_type:complete
MKNMTMIMLMTTIMIMIMLIHQMTTIMIMSIKRKKIQAIWSHSHLLLRHKNIGQEDRVNST